MFEQLLSWARRHPARPASRRPPRRATLMVEGLEERCVPAVTITPGTLPNPTFGAAYSQTLTAKGAAGTVTWGVSGSLPTGLTATASGATETISGTPTAAGPFTFTVTATDSKAPSRPASKRYTLTVQLAISPTTLTAAQEFVGYSQTLSASGGTTPYHFSVASGRLPRGLALNATTGALSGTPQASGTFNFTVQVTDSSSGTRHSGRRSYRLTVKPALVSFVGALGDVSINGILPSFQVIVQDAQYKPLAGAVVSLALIPLGAVGTASFGSGSETAAVTGTNGVATFSGVTISPRGVYEIEAIAGSDDGVSNPFQVGLSGRHSPG